jgi:hypothetical protein
MSEELLLELRRHQRDYPSLIHGPLCGQAADEIERLRGVAQALGIPDGYVLMPREATRTMTMAACDSLPACEHVFGYAGEMLRNAYRKMVEVGSMVSSTDRASPPSVALETGEFEPVAWQYRVMFDKGHVRDDEWCDWHDAGKKYFDKVTADIAAGATRVQTRVLYALSRPQPGGAVAGTERGELVQVPCEMCAGSKWKSACPECDGTGYYSLPRPDLSPAEIAKDRQ